MWLCKVAKRQMFHFSCTFNKQDTSREVFDKYFLHSKKKSVKFTEKNCQPGRQ